MTRWRPAPLLVVGCVAVASAAAAVEPVEWSAPALLFDSASEVHGSALAVDPTGHVYVAWSVHVGHDPQLQQLHMARWDGNAWAEASPPISAPTADAPSLAIDPFADIHLVWHGAMADLVYTWTPAERATAGWAANTYLGDANIRAQLRADPAGRLHLVSPGFRIAGPMYRASDDGGATWTDPVRVAPSSTAGATTDFARLALGAGGVLHVVWTEFEAKPPKPSRGVFYARSTDGGRSWSAATPLAGPGFGQGDVVAVDDHAVHVAWNGMADVGGRYHRWSNDDGATWSAAQPVVARGDGKGPPQLVVDAAHALHLVTTYDAAAWYASWDGARWSAPQCISCAVTPAPARVEMPSAIIANGDELHVVYCQDRHQLWHATARLAAPRLPAAAAQTAGWWSARLWHRDAAPIPALLGVVASIALVRWARRRRSGAA